MTGYAVEIDTFQVTVELDAINPGATITDATGWKVNGVPAVSASWVSGIDNVDLFGVSPIVDGDLITYDGTGSMPITPGTATAGP